VQRFQGHETRRAPAPTGGGPGRGRFLRERLTARRVTVLTIASLVAAIATALGLTFGGQIDIDIYLMGGAHVTSSSLYSLEYAHSGLYFTYPPFAACLFAPLSHLPRDLARVLWALVNASCLLWLLYASIRSVRPELPRRTVQRWTALLAAPAILLNPVVVSFDFGQVNVVLVAFVVADLVLGVTRIPKGVLTGIAAAVKLTPLIFVPYLFLTRQFRAGCTAMATFLACGAIGFLVTPHASWTYWTKDVFDTSRVGGLLSISNQNLHSALMRLAHGPVSDAIVVPVTVVVLALGLGLARWAHRRSSTMLGVLVCATTGLVISPVTWAHHLVWVIPVIVWLAFAPDRPVHGVRWAVAVAVFFWAGPIWWVPTPDRGLHEKPWELFVGDSYLWAMLVFLLGVAALVVSRRRRQRDSTPVPVSPGVSTR
jgi:alpha-1,2-mannosyltransferase